MFWQMMSRLASMNKFALSITLTCAVLSSPSILAAEKTYRCEVLSDAYIKTNGELDIVKDSPRIGQEFAVVKKSGEVIGDVMDFLGKPKIIASGSKSNSYKVIWVKRAAGKNGAFVDYLSIEEFAKGSKKSFGFFSGTLLMTGVCE